MKLPGLASASVSGPPSIGPRVLADATEFSVWAPKRRRVELLWEQSGKSGVLELEARGGGYFSGTAKGVGHGARYRFRLDGGDAYPDPASRFQPEGPWGPSEIVDPGRFRWKRDSWRGVAPRGRVLYELHAGTFTPEGTWSAAASRLAELAEIGVNVIELMPIAEFPGRFGWGYDGVCWFAPHHAYGAPDELRAFVDAAHGTGIGVILDVVYNHFGPEGNVLPQFSEHYAGRQTEWGRGLNFDGPNCGPVRDFVLANAEYWISEFRMDGLRLDATQSIADESREHILAALARRARQAAGGRRIVLVAENQPQEARLLRPVERGGYGLDALWNDDFHHSAAVALSGRREGYCSSFSGAPQELVSSAKWGFLYQGQQYSWQGKRRGAPAFGVDAACFVHYLDNHDQVANRPGGRRIRAFTSPGRHRALTALLLLSPQTPMLFQGQEFGAESPFHYFADHGGELAKAVASGRRRFMAQFASQAAGEAQEAIPDPADRGAFAASTLRRAPDSPEARQSIALHRDLLGLRLRDPVFSAQAADRIHGAVLGREAFALRFFGGLDGDRLLIVNLGAELRLVPSPEPLLAPLDRAAWTLAWSSESTSYGGSGTPPLERPDWTIPAHGAFVLASYPPRNHGSD